MSNWKMEYYNNNVWKFKQDKTHTIFPAGLPVQNMDLHIQDKDSWEYLSTVASNEFISCRRSEEVVQK